jgi:hypothetical protein
MADQQRWAVAVVMILIDEDGISLHQCLGVGSAASEEEAKRSGMVKGMQEKPGWIFGGVSAIPVDEEEKEFWGLPHG